MKMKRFCSACIGAALALGMLATTAQATDMKSVLRRVRWESRVEVHDSARGWICYNKWMYFFGFVVRLPEEMPETLAGLPVVHPGSEDLFETDAPLCVTVRSAEDIRDYVLRFDGGFLSALADEFFSNWAPDTRTPEYAVLQVSGGSQAMQEKSGSEAQALLDLLESQESPAELVGAVYVSPVQYGLQLNGAGLLEVSAETDAPDFWAGIAAAYGLSAAPKPTGTPDGVYTAVWLEIPFAEGAALADRLAADSRILAARAWLYYPDSDCPDAAQIAMYPVYDFGTGDMDENGTANIGDAVLLARYLAEDNAITQPTQNGKNLADMDGDGTLDSADLAALLELLANPS